MLRIGKLVLSIFLLSLLALAGCTPAATASEVSATITPFPPNDIEIVLSGGEARTNVTEAVDLHDDDGIALGYYWNEGGAYNAFLENLGSTSRVVEVKLWRDNEGTIVVWSGNLLPGKDNLVKIDLINYSTPISLSLWENDLMIGNVDSEPFHVKSQVGIYPIFTQNGVEGFYLSLNGYSNKYPIYEKCEGTIQMQGSVYVWYRAEVCPQQ